jgi:hypothetical protein
MSVLKKEKNTTLYINTKQGEKTTALNASHSFPAKDRY